MRWRTRARRCRRGYERIICQSRPDTTRLPAPANALTVIPAAGVVGCPAPGIRRYPGIARTRIICPGPTAVGIPTRAGKVWPPQRTAAASGGIHEAAIVIQVVDAV